MTPPPMTPPRARAGRSASVGAPSPVVPSLTSPASVCPCHVDQEPLEVRPGEGGLGPAVLFHPPAPEVEVDRAGAVLDGGPQRPPVLRHEPPEGGARQMAAGKLPVVRLHQLLQLLQGEVALAPDIAELEVGVVVPRVLVVDDPYRSAVVDEIGSQ